MIIHTRRIQAIQTLLVGSALSTSPSFAVINSEFAEVIRTKRVRQNRRRQLLGILHSTRALDSALKAFTTLHSITVHTSSLGGYLRALEIHTRPGMSQLPNAQRRQFQSNIVNVRNRYMHEAGAYPANDAEIQTLLSEMDNCLITILSL
jgi:hypothetical protein